MRALAIAVIAAALEACWPSAHPRGRIDLRLEADDASRIDTAIRGAGTRLRELVRPDGRFIYEYRVATGVETGDYNIVRHAGAIYALAMFERTAPDPRTRAAIAAASRYLISASVRPVARSADTSAVYSIDAPGEAVLGATGLGVVALLAADQLAPRTIDPAMLRALGNFLIYMQRPDGSFFSAYTADGGRNGERDSLYYPGEAILALARLHAWDHDPRWHDAALGGLRYLARARAGSSDVPSDNWALVATAELLRQRGVDDADRTLLVHHAEQIVETNLRTQIVDPQSPIFGGYTDDGRTTPSSTHLEGLLAASTFVQRDDLRASIDAGIHLLLASQLPDGAIPGSDRRRLVRIDFIQHALSAFIRYRELESRSWDCDPPRRGTGRGSARPAS
jgi:hypothetical protein